MPTTPVRAGRTTASFATFPEDLLARTLRLRRIAHGLTQDEVAARLTSMGRRAYQATVYGFEAGRRNVTAGELFDLAIALETPLSRLLDARTDGAVAVDLGGRLVGWDFIDQLLGGGERLPVRWSEQGWEPRRRGNRPAVAFDRRLRALPDPGVDVTPALHLAAALELGADHEDVQALVQQVAALRKGTAGECRDLLADLLAHAGETDES